MSYTVLARRYRSTTFDEVVGQEHVAQTLKKAIASDRIAHAYLFTGTRGVGKTSMARIMAKALNCLSFDKPTPTPCGTCDSCQRVAKGDDMDVIEIDAASNTGVDNVRDIIENAQYRPGRSRFKVYIIDEVHMLSKAAFNALLKTMEEPPGHVKFILATTEVEKVLPTILSRCQRYDFRNIPTREIAGHLREICKQEKIDADEDALLLVAKAGAGSMRDALSLLDRLLSIGERQLTTDLIESLLGLPKSQLIFDLAQAIGDGDIKSALTRATAMINAGQSVDGLIAALVEHLRNLLILRTCGADSELVEVPGLVLADMVAQSERFDPAALVQDVAILEELRRHVRQSQAGRALLDATIVRMAMADQFASIGELAARVAGGGGNGAAGGGRPGAGPPAGTPRPATARPPGAVTPAPAAAGAQKKNLSDPVGGPVAPQVVPPPVATPPAAARVVAPAPPSVVAPPVVAPPPDVPAVDVPAAVPTAAGTPAALAPQSVAPVAPPLAPPVLSTSVPVPAASVLDSIDFGDDDLPRPGKVWDDSGPSLSELVRGSGGGGPAPTPGSNGTGGVGHGATAPAAGPPPPSPAGAAAVDLRAVWAATVDSLKTQHGIFGVVSQSRLDRIEDGDTAVVRVPAAVGTFARMWDRNGKKDVIRDALAAALGRGVAVRFEVDPEGPAGPAGGPTSASAPASPGRPTGGGPQGQAGGNFRPQTRPDGPPQPAPPPPAASQRVTQEQADAIREQSPLVNALVQQLNAQIVKVE